jgi:hypothetical protein
MKRLLALALALLLLSAPGITPTAAQQTVSIGGTLRNGTADAGFDPTTVPITLRILEGVVEMELRTTIPRADGLFEFEEVPFNAGRIYFLTAEYQGVVYSDTLGSSEGITPAELTVFEASTDFNVLTVTSHTLIITGADSTLGIAEILERISFVNLTDRTLVPDLSAPGMPDFLRFALPPDSHNLDVRSDLVGGEVLEVDRGFAVTTPVPPSDTNGHQMEFIYRAPYEGSTLDLGRTLRFGADTLRVVVAAEVATALSSQLADLGTTTVEGRKLQLLEGAGFTQGELLELQLVGLPEPTFLDRFRNDASDWYTDFGVPGFLTISLGGVLVITLIRRRSSGPPGGEMERRGLVDKIVSLDASHRTGSTSKKRYAAHRQALKDQLLWLDVLQRSSELGVAIEEQLTKQEEDPCQFE